MPDGLVEYYGYDEKDTGTYTAGAVITKGQVVELTGNRTVSPAVAGSTKRKMVAIEDAALNEAVACAWGGVWPITAGVACAAGDLVVVAGAAGKVGPAGVAPDARTLFGYAEEAILLNAAGRVKVGL